jgi:Ca2+/Na+ antiporter
MSAIKNFFYYFFQANPGTEFKYYIPLAVFAVLLIAAAIAFSLIYRNKRKTDFAFKRLFKNLSKRLILIAALAIVYMLVRYENIPYFSMRIWLYLTIALFLFFGYRYVKTYKKDYPKEKTNFELSHPEKKAGNKYLPNK